MGKGAPKPKQPRIVITRLGQVDTQHRESSAGRWVAILLVLGLLGGGYHFKQNVVNQVFAQSGKWVKEHTQDWVTLLKR